MSDWLDERAFYEVCQLYRHSKDYGPSVAPTAIEAFEMLKMFIRNSQAAEIARLKELLNTPEIEDFSKAVRLEAAHQVERWGSIDDRAKRPADWFWLVGYLAGKALHSQLGENRDKALHHCISTAAALCNWHAAIKGTDNRMRPGSSDVEKIVEQSFPGTVASAKGKS